MDDNEAAEYADKLSAKVPLGGRGGLGLERGAGPSEKRRASKAEKELLGSLKGHPAGLASMQTTVARAITHGNANFDPWKKPVKSSELHAVTANKSNLYSHFQSAGVLTGDEQEAARRPSAAASAPAAAIVDKAMLKAIKRALRANSGELTSRALRRAVVGSLLAGGGGVGAKVAKAAVKEQFGRALDAGQRSGKWSLTAAGDTVALARKRRRRADT